MSTREQMGEENHDAILAKIKSCKHKWLKATGEVNGEWVPVVWCKKCKQMKPVCH